MAREAVNILDTGNSLPNFDFRLISGEGMLVPQDLGSRWRVLLIYRGHW